MTKARYYEEFAEYGPPSRDSPMETIAAILPRYCLWLEKLPEDIKRVHLNYLKDQLNPFSNTELRDAAIWVRDNYPNATYDQIGVLIARRAAIIRDRYASRTLQQAFGQPVSNCPHNCKSGLVATYAQNTIRWFLEGDLPPLYGGTLVVYEILRRCPCPQGQQTPQDQHGVFIFEEYDPQRHVKVVFGDVPLDYALYTKQIKPIQIDWMQFRTLQDCLQHGVPLYEAELAKRRQQLGLPTPKSSLAPLRKLVVTGGPAQ